VGVRLGTFLKHKMQEYQVLKAEIESLSRELMPSNLNNLDLDKAISKQGQAE
jgi:hypothetical protein